MIDQATPNDPEREAPLAGRREWIGLAMLALPALLVSMDLSVLHLALPQIAADLDPSATQQLWIVDVYGFLIAGLLITMGNLGDRIGRRRLLLIGSAAFGGASVIAAFAPSAEMLIAARGLLGMAGATLMPSSLALVRNMFPDSAQRTKAISIWFMSFLGGIAVGPLIGGALLELFWWGSAFLIGVPVMALLLVTGPRLLPEYRDADAGRLDPASVVLSLVAMLAIVCGVKEIAVEGVAAVPLAALLAGAALGWAFARRQLRLSDPLLDLSLFADRRFSAAIGSLTAAGVVMGGVGFLLAQYFQLVEGLSALQAGLLMLPPLAVGVAAMSSAPALSRKVSTGRIISGGLLIAATGLAVLASAGSDPGLIVPTVGQALLFAGLMPIGAVGIDAVLSAAPAERAGAASAISETTQELGVSVGIAALGSIATAIYRHGVADAVPENTPASVADAARDTLAGARQVAGELPSAAVTSASDSFVTGMQAAAGVGSIAIAALALIVAAKLRTTGRVQETTAATA